MIKNKISEEEASSLTGCFKVQLGKGNIVPIAQFLTPQAHGYRKVFFSIINYKTLLFCM